MPQSVVWKLTKEMHEVSGHVGRNKTCRAVKKKFHHPMLSKIVAQVVKNCSACQQNRATSVLDQIYSKSRKTNPNTRPDWRKPLKMQMFTFTFIISL